MRDASPLSLFVLVTDEARKVDAPDLLVTRIDAELRQRNAQLCRPSLRVMPDGGAPDRIPRLVGERIVGDRGISLHAGGRDGELHACAVIMTWVEIQSDAVRVGRAVAGAQTG
jgi:hypothetical protein